jgi:surface polysaccharide O-acyltransferase-like enzyme
MNIKADVNAVVGDPDSRRPLRNGGFDALRATMTLLVLFHHSAITYGAMGGWFYHEIKPGGSLASTLLVLFCTVNQAYFMGLFFLLAGYFTPAAVRGKKPLLYVRDRMLRLGIPLLLFGWILGPVTVALAGTSEGHPFAERLLALWHQGAFVTGPLWFAEALLIFSAGALLWYALLPGDPSASRDQQASRDRDRPFPSNATLAIAAVATGAAAWLLRLEWPVGTEIFSLQLGYFASYVVLFVAGCMASRYRWLERLPPTTVRIWRRVALLALPVLPAVYFLGGVVPALRDPAAGPWSPVNVIYAFWEPAVAWGLILVLLFRFQQRFAVLNGFWRSLAARAYAIYVIHPPVLVGVALAWRTLAAPALVKFAVTGTVTCGLCFILAGWLLRIPGARRVF